jgi:hypothetical protein
MVKIGSGKNHAPILNPREILMEKVSAWLENAYSGTTQWGTAKYLDCGSIKIPNEETDTVPPSLMFRRHLLGNIPA